MPWAAALTAVLLYLLPVAVVLACRARAARPLWAVALDIPLAVSLDFLLILTLARFVTLEVATFASRVVWLAGGIAWLALRRGSPERTAWPRAAGVREVGVALVTGAVATWISTLGSRPYSIWDRKWHTPVSASLRGQTIPFENAMAKGQVLHYHFTGDVHAAILQALSQDVLHSSLGLSLSHDVFFGLIGVTFGLLLVGLGARSLTLAVFATAVTLLAGPYTFYRNPAQPHIDGYSVLNYYSMSFRPHDALAGLYYLGIAGALAARLWRGTPRARDTVPALVLSAAGLAITDESSLGLIGLALGLTWIFYPRILHPRRAVGAAILVGLLVAFVVPNVAFAASIAPGAQRHSVAIVPWRSPGCYTPTIPLTQLLGVSMLLADLGPSALLSLGGVLGAIASGRRRAKVIAGMATALFVLSTLALTRIEVNHEALESHRFMSGVVFLAPVLALLALLPWSPRRGGARPVGAPRRVQLRALAFVAGSAGVLLGSGSTVDWIVSVLPVRGHKHDHFFTREDLYALDCRRDFGITLAMPARPLYLSPAIWYAYAGCRPSFAPGQHANAQWALTIGNPYFDKDAVRVLRKTALGPSDPLEVVCQRSPSASTDAVCTYATRKGRCRNEGTRVTVCELTPAQQAEIAR